MKQAKIAFALLSAVAVLGGCNSGGSELSKQEIEGLHTPAKTPPPQAAEMMKQHGGGQPAAPPTGAAATGGDSAAGSTK